jgi:hypothetical protein
LLQQEVHRAVDALIAGSSSCGNRPLPLLPLSNMATVRFLILRHFGGLFSRGFRGTLGRLDGGPSLI